MLPKTFDLTPSVCNWEIKERGDRQLLNKDTQVVPKHKYFIVVALGIRLGYKFSTSPKTLTTINDTIIITTNRNDPN